MCVSVCEFVCVMLFFFFFCISVACSEKLHSKYSKQRWREDEGSIEAVLRYGGGEMDHALTTVNDAKKGGKCPAQSLMKSMRLCVAVQRLLFSLHTFVRIKNNMHFFHTHTHANKRTRTQQKRFKHVHTHTYICRCMYINYVHRRGT